MKRSVAIVGSTPSFVRWAIDFPCALRSADREAVADRTFRELRAIREYSVGREEGRVWNGFCFHPDVTSSLPNAARGFTEREVLEAFGDEAQVCDECDSCPANAMRPQRPNVWAGCYGWFPTDLQFDFERVLRGQNSQLSNPQDDSYSTSIADSPTATIDMIQLVEEAFEDLSSSDVEFSIDAERLFSVTKPRWFAFWQNDVMTEEQSAFLYRLLERVVDRWDPGLAGVTVPGHLIQFVNALKACSVNPWRMHLELIPEGESDGTNWTVLPHCPNCKMVLAQDVDRKSKCAACGRFGNPHGAIRNKVLGLRPYSLLVHVLGDGETAKILMAYESWRIKNPNETNR